MRLPVLRVPRLVWQVGLPLLMLGLIGGGAALTNYYATLPERVELSAHEALILAQDHYAPGSSVALRVLVRNRADAAPVPNAQVEVLLQAAGAAARRVFAGRTDPSGNANVVFALPPDAPARETLIVKTASPWARMMRPPARR